MDRSSAVLFRTYAALLALLALTVASAYVNLGAFNALVNLAIALAKIYLIALFFMHLSQSGALVRVFALAGLFFVLLMFGLTLSDYAGRPLADGAVEGSGAAANPATIARGIRDAS